MGAQISRHRLPLGAFTLLCGIALRNHTPGVVGYMLIRAMFTPWLRIFRRLASNGPLPQTAGDEWLAASFRYSIKNMPIRELRWFLAVLVRGMQFLHRYALRLCCMR